MWLDRADPCETGAKVREDDPNRTGLLAVLAQWREAVGVNAVRTVREIINVAITHPDFMAAPLAVASSKSATVISNDRLGRWLKQKRREDCCRSQSGAGREYPWLSAMATDRDMRAGWPL